MCIPRASGKLLNTLAVFLTCLPGWNGDGFAYLPRLETVCGSGKGDENIKRFWELPDICEPIEKKCFNGDKQDIHIQDLVQRELSEGTNAVEAYHLEVAARVDNQASYFFYDTSLSLGVIFGVRAGKIFVSAIGRWIAQFNQCSLSRRRKRKRGHE